MTWFLPWVVLLVVLWSTVVGFAAAGIGKASRVPLPELPKASEGEPEYRQALEERYAWTERLVPDDELRRILVVDDDANLRELLRTSFESAQIEVEEAEDAAAAAQSIARRRPDLVVLDVAMPGIDGITFCRDLKADPRTRAIPVLLLTGDVDSELAGRRAGAAAFLRKPFSPLALLRLVERLTTEAPAPGESASAADRDPNQLLLYAQDFRQLLEVERGQRRLLQDSYRETVVALAQALEAKDGGTADHSDRVRRYAAELAAAVDPALLAEPGLEYGFILHDVGKIAIPDALLGKREPLSPGERRVLETHPVLGEQMVGGAALIRGHGTQVVRSHHERWDGRGYPDGLGGEEIPLAARIFSVADALDAITSDRPYRAAGSWPNAVQEILRCAGSQFDPAVVDAFRAREDVLRRIYYEVSAN
jgi:response regulator RpfG family c-di-GMP phosphodiesterase